MATAETAGGGPNRQMTATASRGRESSGTRERKERDEGEGVARSVNRPEPGHWVWFNQVEPRGIMVIS